METPFLSKSITKYISLLTVNTSLSISLTLLLVLGISLYAISSWFKQQKKARGAKLPPGNMGWPIVGETLDFIMASQRGHPEKFIIDRMNKYSPKVFTTSLLGEKMVVFCGDSGNKCLFSIDKKIVAPWMPPFLKNILFSPGSTRALSISEMSKQGRGIIRVFIKPGALQQRFVGIMDDMTKQHIENKWAPHREVLAYELVKKHTFSLVCRLFMSIEDPKKVAKLEHLFQGITAGMFSIPINFPGTPLNRAIKYARVFCSEVLPIIKQRKIDLLDKGSDMETSAQDILPHFLLSDDGEFRNDIDVADLILGLFIASQDTTTTVMSYIVKYLAELPHIYAEVLKEQLEIANKKKPGELLNCEDIQQMKYSWSVASEAMRLAPPAQGTFREFINDFTCDGFTIPKGFKAYWTVHSTNKNPEYFENPEKFDPSRFQGNGPAPYTFAPFGGGAHMCYGKDFVRTEILVFMHNIVTRFELEGLMPDEKTIFKGGAVPANGLPIRLHPRNVQ